MDKKKVDHLKIKYDGAAHESHQMDVLELANSLTGLGQLILAANSSLNGEANPVEMKVTGFNGGSFEYCIEVIQMLGDKDILEVLGLTSVAGSLAAGSVLEVVRRLRGRKIDLVESKGDQFDLHVDGERLTCSSDVEKLVASPVVRKAIHQLVYEPTRREGTESFQISAGGQVLVKEEKETAAFYKAPKKVFAEKVSSTEFEAHIKFLTAHADKANQWRVEYQRQPQLVRIDDKLFLERIKSQVSPSIFGETFTVLLEETVTEVPTQQPVTKLRIKKVYHKSIKG